MARDITSVNKQDLNAALTDQSIIGGVRADKAGLAAHTEQIIALLLKSCSPVWRKGTQSVCYGDHDRRCARNTAGLSLLYCVQKGELKTVHFS